MLATSGHTSGHAIRAFRMLPTLQLVFLDRTEGLLGLKLLQSQVISKRYEKKLEEIGGKARERRRDGET